LQHLGMQQQIIGTQPARAAAAGFTARLKKCVIV
jgi:hypothetical protein